jgi:hypothetical protein
MLMLDLEARKFRSGIGPEFSGIGFRLFIIDSRFYVTMYYVLLTTKALCQIINESQSVRMTMVHLYCSSA